jgi:hypothetical protein
MPDDKKIIKPIDASFDEVAGKMVSPATPFGSNLKGLTAVSGQSLATPKQLKLDLGIEVEKVVGGVEMGVLENGIPYLTQRGLAVMTGAARRSVQEITEEWQEAQATGVWRGRMTYFRDYLSKAGFDEPNYSSRSQGTDRLTTLIPTWFAWRWSNISPLRPSGPTKRRSQTSAISPDMVCKSSSTTRWAMFRKTRGSCLMLAYRYSKSLIRDGPLRPC